MIKTKRILINIFLITLLILSLALIYKAYLLKEWNTITGTLAVIIAILATFISLKVIWRQEDEYQPELNAFFDVDSRSGYLLFVIISVR